MNKDFFRNKLLEEKTKLEGELATIGTHEEGSSNWEAVQTLEDESINADVNEVADKIEEYRNNESIVNNLETQLVAVNDALKKLDEGTYGICEISGHPIEQDRLEANPAARTCKEHMND